METKKVWRTCQSGMRRYSGAMTTSLSNARLKVTSRSRQGHLSYCDVTISDVRLYFTPLEHKTFHSRSIDHIAKTGNWKDINVVIVVINGNNFITTILLLLLLLLISIFLLLLISIFLLLLISIFLLLLWISLLLLILLLLSSSSSSSPLLIATGLFFQCQQKLSQCVIINNCFNLRNFCLNNNY